MIKSFRAGISVVIPERENPEYLARCLAAATIACARLNEPWEIIVVANGTPARRYTGCQRDFPHVQWRFSRRPLWFLGAVQRGINAARHDWVYLLNNDVILAAEALEVLLPWRTPRVFGIGSQIFFEDATQRREETNWSSYRCENGAIFIADDLPDDDYTVRGSLYCGGGSSLFRRALLQKLIRGTEIYRPFYWEDVEWGWRAWQRGYECLFCPESLVFHGHRQTNRKFFKEAEIDRLMERNRLIFSLRHLSPVDCEQILKDSEANTRKEILEPRRWKQLTAGKTATSCIEPGPVWLRRYEAKTPEQCMAGTRANHIPKAVACRS